MNYLKHWFEHDQKFNNQEMFSIKYDLPSNNIVLGLYLLIENYYMKKIAIGISRFIDVISHLTNKLTFAGKTGATFLSGASYTNLMA